MSILTVTENTRYLTTTTKKCSFPASDDIVEQSRVLSSLLTFFGLFQVLVTGSLHLVGDVLRLVKR